METSRVWAGPYGKPEAPSAAQNPLRGLEKDRQAGISDLENRGASGHKTRGQSRCQQRIRNKTRSPEAAGRTAESRRDQRPAL